MYSYIAYGIGLHSTLRLPELTARESKADVVISFGELGRPPADREAAEHCSWKCGADVYLYWKDVATFRIRGGKEIVVDSTPGLEERRLRLFLLGAALAVLLHQRGYLVLHASAVELNGAAVLFTGGKAWGKSTMAAALHARGHHFMADDVVAVETGNAGSPLVLPAFPQLKLWPDAISSLGGRPEALPLVSSLIDKRDLRMKERFLQRSLPLGCIYVLGHHNNLEPAITPMDPQEAMLQLLSNNYAARFGKLLLQDDAAAYQLSQYAEVINKVPIFRLNRPRALELLPVIAEKIEEHQGSIINTLDGVTPAASGTQNKK